MLKKPSENPEELSLLKPEPLVKETLPMEAIEVAEVLAVEAYSEVHLGLRMVYLPRYLPLEREDVEALVHPAPSKIEVAKAKIVEEEAKAVPTERATESNLNLI